MEVSVVYPHQLFRPHPALVRGRPVWLVEDPLFFGNDPHWPLAFHKQKLVLHRASMAAYARELTAEGFTVHHVENPAGSALASGDVLESALPRNATELHLADPADDVLQRRLRRFAKARGMALHVHPSPNFLSPDDFLASQLAGEKKPFMARFYQAQRQRLGLLLTPEGGPLGDRWSFDEENRKRLPASHPVPPEPRARVNADVTAAIAWVEARFPDNPGTTEGFRWPVTRRAASAWLGEFLDARFAAFGDYEDAMSTGHAFLHHGALTPALNVGLLDPARLLRRTLAHAAEHAIPLNSLEGFVRQVTGWREFVHGLYRHRGVAIRNGNHFHHERPMPQSCYDGTTGIAPVDRVIRQVLREGWCHHIERLMVLGNFFLLCRIHPDAVYRWFMELFVDAYDWVMVPNVYGMSQFADGGSFTTKPYLSGSNYLRKMSDEPRGDWCAVWDGLFWCFIGDHLPLFQANPRLQMMAANWVRLAPEKRAQHQETAREFLDRL